MGSYIYDEKMLIEEFTDLLDNLEGDFDNEDLRNALEFMKNYAPTTDSTKAQESKWHKLLKEITGEEK